MKPAPQPAGSTEEALRDSELRYRRLFETAQDGILILDAYTGQIIDANPFLLDLLGYTREELLGKRLWEIGFFRDRALAEAASATLQQEGYIRYEDLPLEAKDGRRHEVEFVSNLYEVEHHKVIQCNIRDITERKRAEEALREREARYRKLFDTGDSAVFLIESGTQRFLDANATAVKLYGYSREEFLRMTAADISAESDRTRRAIEAGNTHIPLRWHRRKDGTALPVEITASFVEYEGRRIHMVVIRDISREQQREAAVRELSGRLMRLQDKERRHLARELHDTTAQELAAISMNLAVVRARTSELSADVRTILADTAVLTERCASEIRTMTYLLHPPVLEALGLAGTVRDYTDGFARRSGIRVDLEISDELGRLSHERELALFRVLQESLANILHHSGSRTASIRLVRTTDEVKLEVRDRGRGMKLAGGAAAEELPEFNLGVGILGMRERMRQLGGRLEIHSGAQGTGVAAIVPLDTQTLQP